MNHAAITEVMTSQGAYGTGVTPNPYAVQQKEWQRRKDNFSLRQSLTEKMVSLFEPRFITPPETAELIEAIVTASDARRVLELGMCTGFTSLHILRAICGKEGAKLVSVDARPAHDRDFFTSSQVAPWFDFVEGWTPDALSQLFGHVFDVVFVDSNHDAESTAKEVEALKPITRKGTVFLFHDLPEWLRPDDPTPHPARLYVDSLVKSGFFKGVILPTCEQMDCVAMWGKGYPPQCNPHLGVFIRQL